MEKRISIYMLTAGTLLLFLFLGTFSAFQHETIYQKTLGNISTNYQYIEGGNIIEVRKPFVDITESGMLNWDADIYHCIKENMYSMDSECYIYVKGAFFPLFPMLWKVLGLDARGISLMNYFLFIASIAILVQQFVRKSITNRLLIFTLLISLPSALIFAIPYTEALFLFSMTLLIIAQRSGNNILFFISALSMAMIRPASLFIFVSIIAVDLLCYLSSRNKREILPALIRKALPFLFGFFLAILIQYISSGSFRTMLDAQSFWNSKAGLFSEITDWSKEGFGLNVFSLFFIAFPVCILLLKNLSGKSQFRRVYNYNLLQKENTNTYYLHVSLFYIAGIFLFKLIFAQGNLHSLFRLLMTSPAFYIAILMLITQRKEQKEKFFLVFPFICLAFLALFLTLTEYGGNRLSFPFAGMYLSILFFFLIYYHLHLKIVTQWIFAGILILASLIWNAYLLNIFLNEGWIFT